MRPPGMKRQTMISCIPNCWSDFSAHARAALPVGVAKNRRSAAGPKRRPMRYDRLSPRKAPAAAAATSNAMRGSVLPAVATPRAMMAVSLGRTGKIASSAGMTTAMRYEIAASTWRLVSALIRSPGESYGCRVLFRSSCLLHVGRRVDARRERNNWTHRTSNPTPKAIHGAATIRSLPVICPALCCRCYPVSVHPVGVPAR